MELRQMIEGCFERQNKLIARLEMELEAGPPPRGKDVSCIPACTRTSWTGACGSIPRPLPDTSAISVCWRARRTLTWPARARKASSCNSSWWNPCPATSGGYPPYPTCPSSNRTDTCTRPPTLGRCFGLSSCRSAVCNPGSGYWRSPSTNGSPRQSRYSGHRPSWLSGTNRGPRDIDSACRSVPWCSPAPGSAVCLLGFAFDIPKGKGNITLAAETRRRSVDGNTPHDRDTAIFYGLVLGVEQNSKGTPHNSIIFDRKLLFIELS